MSANTVFWQSHVETLLSHKQSAAEYARTHGLNLATLYYWRRKVLQESSSLNEQSPSFVALKVTPEIIPQRFSGVRLRVGEVHLECDTFPDPQWLAALGFQLRSQ